MIVGFYETRIAYYSWRGAQGYRFANIPDYWGLRCFKSYLARFFFENFWFPIPVFM